MYADAEKISGPTLSQPGDSRITPVGRLFRVVHLDELPQLVNVVRGEMCLVGPRPERPEIIAKNRLAEIVPGFMDRTKVLPGVTGLAQINLPADLTPECVVPKVKLDLEYIETASAGLDLRIMLCTATRMLGIRHGRAVRFFRLERKPQAMSEVATSLSLADKIHDSSPLIHDELIHETSWDRLEANGSADDHSVDRSSEHGANKLGGKRDAAASAVRSLLRRKPH